jgi:[protein-PII] uridylyltransferase
MYALPWTITEAGSSVALPPRSRPGETTPAGPYDAAPGAVVRHVLRAAASDPAVLLDRQRWLARVRPLVDRSQAMLRARFEADGSVEAFLHGRTRLADGAVIGLFHLARAVVRSTEAVTAIAPVAVVAAGGYGRRELGPASDLDLLFLLGDAAGQRADAERLIGFALAGLWDLGFEVGHATRTVAECMKLARIDHRVLGSLLDARFLAGSFTLHAILDADVRQTVKDAGSKALAAAAAPTRSTSWRPTADDEAEPDVKRGPGALRDIQRLQWLAKLDHLGTGSGARSELARPNVPVPPSLAEAHRFLWQVRCHLHLLTGRAQDRLVRELQPLVARRLGLGRDPDAGVAELMARYHACTRAVRALLTTH